jgi:hypothetical protein
MKVGSKSVHLVGWYHGSVEWDMAQIAFNSSYADAQSGNCKQAQEKLREVLPKLHEKEAESRRVLSLLEDIYRQNPFTILGVEHAPYQYTSLHVKDGSLDMALQYLTKLEVLCPNEISTFKRMHILYPGPEYEFARNKTENLKIVPMGDDLLIKKSNSALSAESQNFQLYAKEMSSEAIMTYNKFVDRTKLQPLPDSAELDLMVDNLKKSEKIRLKKYFSEVNYVLGLFAERDLRFAEQILKQKNDDVALVIGSRHLTGIKSQLQKLCKD